MLGGTPSVDDSLAACGGRRGGGVRTTACMASLVRWKDRPLTVAVCRDTTKQIVAEPGEDVQALAKRVRCSNDVLDTALATDGFSQNRWKEELLMHLVGEGPFADRRLVRDGKVSLPGKVVSVARHLCSHLGEKAPFAHELPRRRQATMTAFNSVGQWHESRVSLRLKRCFFIGRVVNTALSGIEAFCTSKAQYQSLASLVTCLARRVTAGAEGETIEMSLGARWTCWLLSLSGQRGRAERADRHRVDVSGSRLGECGRSCGRGGSTLPRIRWRNQEQSAQTPKSSSAPRTCMCGWRSCGVWRRRGGCHPQRPVLWCPQRSSQRSRATWSLSESDANRCTLRRSRQLRKLLPHPSRYQSDHAQQSSPRGSRGALMSHQTRLPSSVMVLTTFHRAQASPGARGCAL